jgi:hypothetical protein
MEKKNGILFGSLMLCPQYGYFGGESYVVFLPVKSILKHRHIAQLSRCKFCVATNEDLMHALISYVHARGFWEEAQSWLNFTLPKLHPNT